MGEVATDIKKKTKNWGKVCRKIINAVTTNYETGCAAPRQRPQSAKFAVWVSLQLARPGLLISQESKFLPAFFIPICSTLGISCARPYPGDLLQRTPTICVVHLKGRRKPPMSTL